MKRESQIAFSNKSQAKSGMMKSRWLDRMISVGRARSSPNMDGTKEEEEHVQTFKSCEFSYPPAGLDIVPPSSVTHYRPVKIYQQSHLWTEFNLQSVWYWKWDFTTTLGFFAEETLPYRTAHTKRWSSKDFDPNGRTGRPTGGFCEIWQKKFYWLALGILNANNPVRAIIKYDMTPWRRRT